MDRPDFLDDRYGEVRLAGDRVSLFNAIAFYRQGYSAETIRERFPTLPMVLIHEALGFYWENHGAFDDDRARTRHRLDEARSLLSFCERRGGILVSPEPGRRPDLAETVGFVLRRSVEVSQAVSVAQFGKKVP